MKKKLLMIGLVFCCVWGVFAQQKLLDAIKNGDLNTVKAQIELLDVDPSTVFDYAIDVWGELSEKNSQYYSGLSRYDQNYFNREFYEQSDKYKAIIQYLHKKGATVGNKFIQKWMDESDGGKCVEILKYMLENKIIDMNSSFTFGYYNFGNKYDMDEHYSTATISDYYYGLGIRKDNGKGWFEKFLLISEYAAVPSEYIEKYNFATLLFGDIAGVKSLIRNGTNPVGATQLFIRNKYVIELLKATDNYKLDVFKGYITPYYVGTIIPKYCTQCLTEDEIGIIKLIADYDASRPRDAAIEKIKTYIANGVDLMKSQYVLGGAKIGDLPKMIGKFGADDIVGDIARAEEERIAAKKAEEEARIKAEKERIARDKAKEVEEKFVTEVIPKYKADVKNSLIMQFTQYKAFFEEVNGRYTLTKKKRYREQGVTILESMKSQPKCFELPDSYILSKNAVINKKDYEGITVEIIETYCGKAKKEVFDELVIQ